MANWAWARVAKLRPAKSSVLSVAQKLSMWALSVQWALRLVLATRQVAQRFLIEVGGVLYALVTVMDEATMFSSAPDQGLARRRWEAGIESRAMARPSNRRLYGRAPPRSRAGVGFVGRVGHVADPDLIGLAWGRSFPQPVGPADQSVTAFGGAGTVSANSDTNSDSNANTNCNADAHSVAICWRRGVIWSRAC